MFGKRIQNLFAQKLAIDLGTAYTRIYVGGYGMALQEPSLIAVHQSTGAVLAVGREAESMLGQEPYGITVCHPLKAGAVADLDQTVQMLKAFLRMVRFPWPYARALMCLALSAPDFDRAARQEALERVGLSRSDFLDAGLAAALGGKGRLAESTPMVIDLGGGRTHYSVLSPHGVIRSYCLKVGGVAMTEAIIFYIEAKYDLTVSYAAAEDLKRRWGSATPPAEAVSTVVFGKSLRDGTLQTAVVWSSDVWQALAPGVAAILKGAQRVFEQMPMEAARRVYDHGVVLVGGGALLRDWEARVYAELGARVQPVEHPLEAAVLGAGQWLEKPSLDKPFHAIRTMEMLSDARLPWPVIGAEEFPSGPGGRAHADRLSGAQTFATPGSYERQGEKVKT